MLQQYYRYHQASPRINMGLAKYEKLVFVTLPMDVSHHKLYNAHYVGVLMSIVALIMLLVTTQRCLCHGAAVHCVDMSSCLVTFSAIH